MNKKKRSRFNNLYDVLGSKLLSRVLVLIVISQFLSFLIISILLFIMFTFGDWEIDEGTKRIPAVVVAIVGCLTSFVVSLFFSFRIGRRFLQPINDLKLAADQVAKGDFKVHIEYHHEQGEIAELINNFNFMTSELRKNEMLKNDFISNVSHEFKTPLSTIQGYATLLQDENLSLEDRKKYTNIIIESTNKLTTLVSNILKISKLENSKVMVSRELYPLDEQIREVILELENKWSSKNINLSIDLANVLINNDKSLLSNVWSNLIGNAIKFTKDNGNIFIGLTIDNGFAKVVIQDDGIGIDENNLPYIFDKFYQGDRSHSGEGNGLGLALSKKIIDLLNGKIEVISKVNKGTIFTILLPL